MISCFLRLISYHILCPLGGGGGFWAIVVRPSSKHQGCSLRLPSVSVVSLLLRSCCALRGDLESVHGSLLATRCLYSDKDRGSSFLSAGCSSRAKATSSVPGTCWSAHRRHLRELGSVSPFCLVRSVTHFRSWPELWAWIVRSAWRNRVGKIGWVRRPSCAVVPGECFC